MSLVTADNRTVILNCLTRVRSERDDGISPQPTPYVALSSEAFRPSCFGLPFAQDKVPAVWYASEESRLSEIGWRVADCQYGYP